MNINEWVLSYMKNILNNLVEKTANILFWEKYIVGAVFFQN